MGLIQQVGVDFRQEGGRRVAAGLAEDQAAAGGGKVQFLFGAGDSHVAKAALLFHVLFIIAGHVAGKNTVFHTHNKDVGELQALGGVDGHHRDAVGVLVIAVQVGDQGDFLEETCQGRVLAVLVDVGLDRADELAQVLKAGLAFLFLGFQHSLVAGFFHDLAGKFIQRQRDREVAQLAVHLIEFFQRGGGTLQFGVFPHMADDLQHGHTVFGGQVADLFYGGGTDLTGGFIDDAAQAHIVPRVDDDGQVGVDVLDFLAVKEALAAHDAVRDARAGEVGFDGVGLGIHAVEHGVIPQVGTLPQMLADDVGQMAGFVLLVGGGVVVDLFAVAVLGPQSLALAACVVFDDAIGGIEDVGSGTVVLFQANGLGPLENLLKVEDVLDGGAAELVDGLVVITDNADIVGAARQQAHKVKLGNAGVLILVHNYVLELILIVAAGFLIVLQQLDGVVDQVVEVHRARLFQPGGVGGVDFGDERRLGVAGGLRGNILGREQLVFKGADLADS